MCLVVRWRQGAPRPGRSYGFCLFGSGASACVRRLQAALRDASCGVCGTDQDRRAGAYRLVMTTTDVLLGRSAAASRVPGGGFAARPRALPVDDGRPKQNQG